VKQVHTRQTKKLGFIDHQSTGNNSALLLGKCSAIMSLWYCHLCFIHRLTIPNLTMAPPPEPKLVLTWHAYYNGKSTGQMIQELITSMIALSNILTGVYHRLTWHIPEDRVMSTMSGSHTGQIQWHQDTAAVL